MGLLYTRLKIFHFPDKIRSLPKANPCIQPPLHIRLKPTNICNHHCRYCAYRSGTLQLGQDMNIQDWIPRDKMMEILDDIIAMGVRAVTFSGGGEPFCYPHLLEATRKLAGSAVQFSSLTNGSRLTGEIAQLFAQYATWLRISIDGWDDESYATYRGVPPGEFRKVLDNIRAFKSLGGSCYLGASVIVDRTNAAHVYELTGRLYDCGVDSVKVSPCIVSNESEENNRYHEPIFELVKQQTADAVRDFCRSGFEIFDSYHQQLDSFRKSYCWCPSVQIIPVIGADLNVYTCHDKAYNLETGVVGSIRNCRFRDFWMDGKEKFFKVNPSIHCNHHCVANIKNRMIMEVLDADPRHLAFV